MAPRIATNQAFTQQRRGPMHFLEAAEGAAIQWPGIVPAKRGEAGRGGEMMENWIS